MDKKTILAFVFIGLILIITQTKFYREKILKLPPKQQVYETVADSTKIQKKIEKPAVIAKPATQPDVKKESLTETVNYSDDNPLSVLLKASEEKVYEDVVVETKKYIARINPKGGVISSWVLKDYDYNGEEKVELIQEEGYGNLGVFFVNNEDTLHTFNAVFEPSKTQVYLDENNQTETVQLVLDLGENRKLIKSFVFHADEYIVDFSVNIDELAKSFDQSQYFLTWKSGLNYSELDYSNHVSKEDVTSSVALVYQGGSKESLKLPNKPNINKSRSDFSGVVDWTAIRTKYFTMIILPDSQDDVQPILYGETEAIYRDQNLKDRVKKTFSVTLKNQIPPNANISSVSNHYRVYIGPMDYSIIKKYHPTLEKLMDFGMALIRPFAKIVLKTFIFLHQFIPNYGIVLILFAIFIKILVWPLTKKSYASMHRMQTLQPKLNELKEKYGKDPQRLNKETMKLYKEEGVNPVSGCLPQLLQMPLLFAIFIIFRNTIELRDAGFIFWITDLSAPDTIFQLPFTLPFYGNLVNVLPLVMGATMFFQQKMTMRDPKQKAMVYFMPIFFTLLFNTFPSGLNLYYTLFNIFSILQQKYAPEQKQKEETSTTVKGPKPVKKLDAFNKKSKRK